jgi:hypothetical protein
MVDAPLAYAVPVRNSDTARSPDTVTDALAFASLDFVPDSRQKSGDGQAGSNRTVRGAIEHHRREAGPLGQLLT